jgi:hypothetical protein
MDGNQRIALIKVLIGYMEPARERYRQSKKRERIFYEGFPGSPVGLLYEPGKKGK